MIKDIELIKSACYNLLLDLESVLKEFYGANYTIKLTKADDVYMLSTNNFIMTYSVKDLHYYLTFIVGQTGKQIVTDLKQISLVLDHSEFTVMDDSHFDKDSKGLVFGMEAILSKQKDILAEAGKIKCPVCEKIYNKDQITDKGICKYCNMDNIRWN